MSEFWNRRIKNISPYIPGEQPKDRQFIKLNTNENPYPPSPKVIEAIHKAAGVCLRLYPDPECSELREAVAKRYGVKPQQVFAGNGSDEILGFAFGAFFESAGAGYAHPVLFPDITYSFYPVYADLWDVPYRTIPLCEDFSVNINEYKTACGGVILPNPNAPTAMAIPLDDILSLADFLYSQPDIHGGNSSCENPGKVFIVDEAYAAFGAQSAVNKINEYPNLLTVHTLSKSASLAGLRAGFAIGSEELIEGLRRIRDSFNSYTLDRLALAGAAAAISDEDYYNDINNRVIATRQRTAQVLSCLGFNVLQSAANFLFINYPGINGKDLFTSLREMGILVRHFNKERISDFLRVSIGTDEEMDKFIDCCRGIINESINIKKSF